MPKVKCREYLTDLQNFTKGEIPLTEIAKNLIISGVSKQQDVKKVANSISNRIYNDGYFNDDEIRILDKVYKSNEILLPQNDNSEHFTLDYYPDIEVSCGNGIIPFGETKEKMTVPVSLIKGYSKNKKYVIVNATSDSMQPEIKPNDMLIIRVTDTDTIIDNHIYVFCYEDRLYCKYLSYNVNQIIVRSANKDYPTRFIEKENINNFRLCGEVCGHFRSYLR